MDFINFEDKETHDYMKNAIDNCATEMIEKITNYEIQMSSKIEELQNNLKSNFIKINVLEDSLTSFNIYQEKLYKKMIHDIAEQQDFKKNQDIINKNNDKKIKEQKKLLDDNMLFKERVNDTITNLQSRIENIENDITKDKVNIKKVTNIENEIKKLTKNIDSLKKSLNKFSKNEEMNKTKQNLDKDDINEKILNIVKMNDAKYDELNNKFTQLLNELDMIRRDTKNTESIYIQSIKKDIKEINQKIKLFDKKILSIDVTNLSKNIEIKVKKKIWNIFKMK